MLNKKKRLRLLTGAGIIVLLLFGLFYTKLDLSISGIEATRFAVVQAFGEQGVFYINNTEFRTVDVVKQGPFIYSDKPLPLAFSLGVVHRVVNRLTGLNFHDNYHLLIYLYNFLIGMTINTLIFLWLFRLFRRCLPGSLEAKGLLALAAVMGSWILSYSVVLNNHTPAALFLLGAFILLEKYRRKPSLQLALLIGFSGGAIAAADIPCGVLSCPVFAAAVWMMTPRNIRNIAAVSGAVILSAVLFAGLNYYAYKTIIPLYIVSGGTYIPGVDMKNHLGYAVECLIGYRGLLIYQPFLLLSFAGAWMLRKKLSIPEIAMLILSVLITVFYLYMTNEFGGAAYGFRYLIPLIPVLWYFACVPVLKCSCKAVKALAVILIFCGIAGAVVGAYAPFGFAFEGHRSPARHPSRFIRSSFAGNLLSWSYENDPDSLLTRKLREHYGRELSRSYLRASFLTQKKMEPLGRISQER